MKNFKTGAAAVLAAALLIPQMPRAAAAGTEKMLVPVGRAVGIEMRTQGVVVAKSGGGAVKAGDIIIEMNGKAVECGDDIKAISAALEPEESVEFVVIRDGAEKRLSDAAAVSGGSGALGLWLRDTISGIGTVTYYDPESGAFGALGHSISDAECGIILPLRCGIITETEISAVIKGAAGAPGQLCGNVDESKFLGEIEQNTACGIFGSMARADWIEGAALPVAELSEVKAGPAMILSNVEGGEVCGYTVEIARIYGGDNGGRDMMIKVTDERLLEKTGGIVQGISGSPILQRGKLVGAVTHVLVGDPEKGYGISMENMLASSLGEGMAA